MKNTERVTKSELARRIGCHRETAARHLAEKGAPAPDGKGRYAFDEAALWIERRAPRVAVGESLRNERLKLMRVQRETKEHELRVRRNEFITIKEVSDVIVPLMAELGALIQQMFCEELPAQYIGRDAVDCRQLNEAARDVVIDRFRNGSLKIRESKQQFAKE